MKCTIPRIGTAVPEYESNSIPFATLQQTYHRARQAEPLIHVYIVAQNGISLAKPVDVFMTAARGRSQCRGRRGRCAKLCFGGVKRNQLFMAASHSIYTVYVNTQGWRSPDPRSLLNFRRKAPTVRPPASLLGSLRRRPFWHMLIDTVQRPVGEIARDSRSTPAKRRRRLFVPLPPIALSVAACSRTPCAVRRPVLQVSEPETAGQTWSGAMANCRYSFWAAQNDEVVDPLQELAIGAQVVGVLTPSNSSASWSIAALLRPGGAVRGHPDGQFLHTAPEFQKLELDLD